MTGDRPAKDQAGGVSTAESGPDEREREREVLSGPGERAAEARSRLQTPGEGQQDPSPPGSVGEHSR